MANLSASHPIPPPLSPTVKQNAPSSTIDDPAAARSLSPVSPTIMRASTAASEASAQHRSKFHPMTFHHSHFAKNAEKDTLSMAQLKQALFPNTMGGGADQPVKFSDIRVGPSYIGDKVFMRTGLATVTRDSRTIAIEKEKRRQLVSRTGFSSANHETYKSLGEPILDPEKLISTSLNISITTATLEHHSAIHSAQRNFQATLPQEELPQNGNKNQTNVNDGFDVLKEKLMKAKSRLQSIKFGIPLSKTLHSSSWNEAEAPVQPMASSMEFYKDWTPLKLDREKMIYYLRLLGPSPPSQTITTTSPANKTMANESKSTPLLPKLVKHMDHRKSIEEMEHALMIQRPSLPDPESMLHQMRLNFNKEKQRLSTTFKSQLLQVERERPALIYEKFRVFQIGVNGICSSDLERMRVNAKRQRKQERHRLLEIHPWYKDMVKLAYSNPLRKTLTEAERVLLYHVRLRIGDKIPLTKHEFVEILKAVPTSEYMKEEVQKLIKFLKLRIGLTELEYLDAIESSGQMLTTTTTSF